MLKSELFIIQLKLIFWKRREIFSSKISLGLNIEKKYILFGAQGGVNNPRKVESYF